jgi:hypothetical protein
MEPAAAAEEIALPEELPFLQSLSWSDADFRKLAPIDILRRYEAGWRHLGVLADPSPEEWELIRSLAARYGSFLRV